MMLLTKKIKATLPPLYSQENKTDPLAVVKFFSPSGRGTWYATEGGPVCPEHAFCDCKECPQPWGNFLFFGWVASPLGADCDELGYFSLSELASVRGHFGLGIERDLYFKPKPLSEVRRLH